MEQKILNVGVISCSGMAQSHMLAVKAHERARLAAICDVDEEKLRQAGEKLQVPEIPDLWVQIPTLHHMAMQDFHREQRPGCP